MTGCRRPCRRPGGPWPARPSGSTWCATGRRCRPATLAPLADAEAMASDDRAPVRRPRRLGRCRPAAVGHAVSCSAPRPEGVTGSRDHRGPGRQPTTATCRWSSSCRRVDPDERHRGNGLGHMQLGRTRRSGLHLVATASISSSGWVRPLLDRQAHRVQQLWAGRYPSARIAPLRGRPRSPRRWSTATPDRDRRSRRTGRARRQRVAERRPDELLGTASLFRTRSKLGSAASLPLRCRHASSSSVSSRAGDGRPCHQNMAPRGSDGLDLRFLGRCRSGGVGEPRRGATAPARPRSICSGSTSGGGSERLPRPASLTRALRPPRPLGTATRARMTAGDHRVVYHRRGALQVRWERAKLKRGSASRW